MSELSGDSEIFESRETSNHDIGIEQNCDGMESRIDVSHPEKESVIASSTDACASAAAGTSGAVVTSALVTAPNTLSLDVEAEAADDSDGKVSKSDELQNP
jgi:hypothetical protein